MWAWPHHHRYTHISCCKAPQWFMLSVVQQCLHANIQKKRVGTTTTAERTQHMWLTQMDISWENPNHHIVVDVSHPENPAFSGRPAWVNIYVKSTLTAYLHLQAITTSRLNTTSKKKNNKKNCPGDIHILWALTHKLPVSHFRLFLLYMTGSNPPNFNSSSAHLHSAITWTHAGTLTGNPPSLLFCPEQQRKQKNISNCTCFFSLSEKSSLNYRKTINLQLTLQKTSLMTIQPVLWRGKFAAWEQGHCRV